MINAIYTTISIVLASALFVLGLLFYSLSCNSETPVFRRVLRIMVFTYCFFGLINVLELWSRTFLPETEDVLLFQMTTLIVAASQAFLFTFTLILLIHAAYFTRKRVLREIAYIFTFSILFVALYFILPAAWHKISVWLFTLFYGCLLIRYTRLFTITYRNCRRKMENFFSDREAEHLKWVNFSFYAALSIGVLTLAASLFPVMHIGVLCSAICFIFYCYFACRLINYGNIYEKLAVALADDVPQSEQPDEDKNRLPSAIVESIENKLKVWLNEKRFLQPGVTIDDLSLQIGTNRNYLSMYINSTKGKTFRQWINELRIDYAKQLFDQNPELELWQIAEQTGYTDNSYFSKCFKKITQTTPSKYRKN